MKIFKTLRERTDALVSDPGQELGRWARFIRFQAQLWRFCGRRLVEHNALAMSAALSFRTIFALVPMLVLALLVMKPLGLLGDRNEGVHKALEALGFRNIQLESSPRTRPADGDPDGARQGRGGRRRGRGRRSDPDVAVAGTQPVTAPADGRGGEVQVLADWFIRLAERAEAKLTVGRLGPVGVLLFIWAAVAMLGTLESSLNRIFEAVRSRSLARRVLLYWSVVTLGPVLMAGASYVGGEAAGVFKDLPGVSLLMAMVGWTGPIIVGIVLLAALYKLMPNTHVPFRAAIGGALVAVPLWLLAEWAFTVYVGHVAGTSVYGKLGLLPLFLIWVNLSWTIFLFGAEVAHTAVNLKRMQMAELAERTVLGPTDLLAVTVAVGRQYVSGKGPAPFNKIAAAVSLPAGSVLALLDRLIEAKVVCPVRTEEMSEFVLARPAGQILLAEVLSAGDGSSEQRCDKAIADVIGRVRERSNTAFEKVTLADALAEKPSA